MGALGFVKGFLGFVAAGGVSGDGRGDALRRISTIGDCRGEGRGGLGWGDVLELCGYFFIIKLDYVLSNEEVFLLVVFFSLLDLNLLFQKVCFPACLFLVPLTLRDVDLEDVFPQDGRVKLSISSVKDVPGLVEYRL